MICSFVKTTEDEKNERSRYSHFFRVYFHRGQTTTGRLSPNTNTEEETLTQESGDVRSVEGEVCGAVLVDE